MAWALRDTHIHTVVLEPPALGVHSASITVVVRARTQVTTLTRSLLKESLYEVLGVNPGATLTEIKQAYKKMVRHLFNRRVLTAEEY